MPRSTIPYQVRDFAATFGAVGLPASFPNMAYGLAEHTVGCSSFSPNPGGADLNSIADERLQCSGGTFFVRTCHVDVRRQA